jgi:hypothetical protein
MGLNKKLVMAIVGISAIIATTILGYKSLENLNQLDLDDPFEVNFDDE